MRITGGKYLSVLFSALLLLSGCGGGSSSSTGFPVDAAVSAFYSSARSFTITNHDSPSMPTITYTLTPAADATFEGQAAKTLNYTSALEENGMVLENVAGTTYFQTNSYRFLGTTYVGGEIEIGANQRNLPAKATTGQSGDFYTSTTYADASKAAVTLTSVVRWSLESDPDSASGAKFCVNETLSNTGPDDLGRILSCFRIDEAGSVLGITRSFFYNDGSSLVFD